MAGYLYVVVLEVNRCSHVLAGNQHLCCASCSSCCCPFVNAVYFAILLITSARIHTIHITCSSYPHQHTCMHAHTCIHTTHNPCIPVHTHSAGTGVILAGDFEAEPDEWHTLATTVSVSAPSRHTNYTLSHQLTSKPSKGRPHVRRLCFFASG